MSTLSYKDLIKICHFIAVTGGMKIIFIVKIGHSCKAIKKSAMFKGGIKFLKQEYKTSYK